MLDSSSDPSGRGDQPVANGLVLLDLTDRPRFGLKGAGAAEWLARQGLRVPDRPNEALFQPDATIVARLGADDLLVLADAVSPPADFPPLRETWRAGAGRRGHDTYRNEGWAWLHIAGLCAPALMAKICAVDLRPTAFPPFAVAQTRVIDVNAVIIRTDRQIAPGLDMLFDISTTESVLGAVLDAGGEFGIRRQPESDA